MGAQRPLCHTADCRVLFRQLVVPVVEYLQVLVGHACLAKATDWPRGVQLVPCHISPPDELYAPPRRRLRAFLSAWRSSPALPACLWSGLRGGLRGGTTRGSGLGPPSARRSGRSRSRARPPPSPWPARAQPMPNLCHARAKSVPRPRHARAKPAPSPCQARATPVPSPCHAGRVTVRARQPGWHARPPP